MSEKLKIVYRPLQELSPYAHNARTHSTEQVAQLVESIKQFGWTNPVLIDEKGEIIAGHGRVMAAEMLKMDSVPVIVLSGLTDEQKKAYRLADNRLPMNAGWDEDLLRMELSDLINADFDVSLTGFGPTQIDELLTDVLPGTGNKEEGNTNISGVTVVFRAGEQEQTPPEGFESSGSETVLGTEVKYDTPITRTITSANIDRLRFTFGVQALVETTSKGDRNPSEVRLLVQIQRNGGWVTEKDITIKGKTTSQYLASVVVDNLPPRPFSIRMRRMTPDSTTDQLQNKTLWSSYTEIIDVKQCYPNTALFGVQVDSEQFGSQQVSRNYHLRGRILQVPSNYNPQTRQYSGIWDGTFKPAYSNNMAWCMWDMLTHPRYGMGKRLGAADVDKWALYVIGQYCDQSVPDGFGGTEPRITCNAYLTTQRKAWDVLSDFCSAMRCMPVWNGQTLTFVQDRPSDKVWTYNRSNVVMPDDGAPFRYSFSALKDRHNAVEVNWIDPNNGWETATELVEDTQAIARYGRNVTKMDAFGCAGGRRTAPGCG